MEELSIIDVKKIEKDEAGELKDKSRPEKKESHLSLEEAHNLANMMRAKIGVDESGTITDPTILGYRNTGGMPIYPSKEQYEQAFEDIKELEELLKNRNLNEKIISELKRITSLGRKEFFKFLLSLSLHSKKINEFAEGEIIQSPEQELKDLKEKGDNFGQKEIQLAKDIENWKKEEEEYSKY